MVNTDRNWELIAQRAPFWGVLTDPDYGPETFSQYADQFFQSGTDHVADILTVLREHVKPDFAPTTALDFGCGVGRLVLPLSRVSDHVTGLDISPTMLKHARSNAEQFGYTNIALENAATYAWDRQYDLVHSVIVLQHISPRRGAILLRQLIDSVAPGGCGVIQLNLRGPGGPAQKLIRTVAEHSQPLHRIAKRLQRRDPNEALMLVHAYDATTTLATFSQAGIAAVHTELRTDATDLLDAVFYFTRPASL